jgi:5,10-methylenetetrahydromethanopterin reductase
MRFSLAIDHLTWRRGDAKAAVERTFDLATVADDAGIDSLWLNEDPDGWDAFAVLSAIATKTHSIHLGPGVTNPYHRHPNLIAASVSTLDRLSLGRAFLGLGRGQPEWYARSLGIGQMPPLPLVEETIDLCRQWWAEPHVASSEGPISVRQWQRSFGPLGPKPIYLAAVGPKALALAGRLADGVLFNELATPTFLEWAITRVREAAVRTGRDPQTLRFFANPALTVTDDPEPLLERKRGLMAVVHALPGMERLLMSDQSDVAAIMAEVRRQMRTTEVLERGGSFHEIRAAGDLARAKAAIPLSLVDEAALIGPLDQVRAKLETLEQLGVTDCFLDRRGLPGESGALKDLLAQLSSC